MIKELMEWIGETWIRYWGDGWYQYLFFIAVIYLLVRKRKDENIKALLLYSGCALFVFVCPFTAWIMGKCIGKSVYWRVLWLVPTVPVIGIAAVHMIRNRRRSVRVLLTVAFVGSIAVCGKSMTGAENYVIARNFQQVPDEVAQICSLIRQDAAGKKIYLAADDHIASYARVYDPSIYMPYGRGGKSARGKRASSLYKEIMLGGDYKRVASLAARLRCNYVVGVVHDLSQISFMEERGYYEIGTVNDYRIFAKK